MKKRMVMAIALFAACMQGMEKEVQNSWSITVGKTRINLNKGNILDSGDGNKADVIVVKYGAIDKHAPNQLQQNRFLLTNKNKLVEVNGPCVGVSPYLDVFYERYKPGYKLYRAKLFSKDAPYSVDAVVGEALKDLKLCYTETLTKAVQEQNEKVVKSIALPALTVGSYKSHYPTNCTLENQAMHCTITTIFEFINNNPDAYDNIDLFVEEEFEFTVCKNLLDIIIK